MRMLGILLLASTVFAQDLTPKWGPQQTFAIKNATIHTVSGKTFVGSVYVSGGKIEAVGEDQGPWPSGVKVYDLAGKHVYPGLIAPHTQLGLSEIGAVRASRDFNEVGDATPEVYAAVAVNPDSTLLPVTRQNGILTFAAFPRGGLIPGRMSVMRMDGWTHEDMTIRKDGGLLVTWPNRRVHRRFIRENMEHEPLDKIAKRRKKIEMYFADAKAYLAAKQADPDTPHSIRWEAMRPALEGKRPVFFRVDELDGILTALDFAKKWGLKPVLLGGRDAGQCLDEIKAIGARVLLSSIHVFPKRNDAAFDAVYRLPARLEQAGIPWCLASGERTANVRNLPYAAARAVAYGLSEEAAIRSITLYAARVLGVDDRLGSLEKGKAATLIVTSGNPLEVTTNVEMAWIDGRRIDLTSKQTKLYEKYRGKYRELGLIK